MGNQQMLLIALGTIIVGIAIIVGVNLFSVSFSDQVKDLAIHKVHDIGMRANVYRKTSTDLGGGGGSYKGFNKNLNDLLKEDEIIKKFKLKENKNKITITLTLKSKADNNKTYRILGVYDQDGLVKLRYYEADRKKWVWLHKRD